MNRIRETRVVETEAGCSCQGIPASGQNGQCRRTIRASAVGLVALLLAAVAPDRARAVFLYQWLTTSGPTLKASFHVSDAAVLSGTVHSSDLTHPPGFWAASDVGTFTDLTADSSLTVDPVTGDPYTSASYFTATNGVDTLLLSASGYFIPSSPLQPRGRGRWNAIYLPAWPPPSQLTLLGFTNGQAQLQVTCIADLMFVIEASEDLSHWRPILASRVVGGVSKVTDQSRAKSATRFYRATYMPLPPCQLTLLGFTNRQPQLQVTCPVDLPVVIEASGDLSQWKPVLTNQVAGGTCTVTDPSPPSPAARFYRALSAL